MTVQAVARSRTSVARRWMEQLRQASGKGASLADHPEAPDLARAREARSYVRKLVAERGWTEDIEREAEQIVAAERGWTRGIERQARQNAAAAVAAEGRAASRARAGGRR